MTQVYMLGDYVIIDGTRSAQINGISIDGVQAIDFVSSEQIPGTFKTDRLKKVCFNGAFDNLCVGKDGAIADLRDFLLGNEKAIAETPDLVADIADLSGLRRVFEHFIGRLPEG